MADEKPSEPGSALTHMPLPYVVKVRLITDDDQAPSFRERHVFAYSVIEASMQVCLEAGASGINDPKIVIEHIQPDMEVYARLFQNSLIAALAKLEP